MKPPSVAVIQVEPSHMTPSAAASFGVNDTLESWTWVAACRMPKMIATQVITPSSGVPTFTAVINAARNKSDAIAEFICAASYEKLRARFPSSRGHPEASTNTKSFSGIVITVGGSMNIPSAISTAATIKSITRNGR